MRCAILWLALVPGALAAQRREMEIRYGHWLNGNDAAAYEFRTSAPLFGGDVLSHGFGVTVLVSDTFGRHRAFYGLGWELQAFRHRAALAPYGVLGVELGLSTDTARQAVAALWSLGVGLEWRPLSFFAVGGEARYRLEDRGPHGFWSPRDARRGLGVSFGASLGVGGGRRRTNVGSRAPPAATGVTPRLPPQPPVNVTGGAAAVVQTALAAIGSPYQWGGTAANGFDCSGLIQYAYAQHGIRLPRMSRDQALWGTAVTPVAEALQPGDVLLFSAQPGGGVTHVGMYVGEGKFIHSSSTGVKLSYLDPHDAEGAYWLPRWVGARRITGS